MGVSSSHLCSDQQSGHAGVWSPASAFSLGTGPDRLSPFQGCDRALPEYRIRKSKEALPGYRIRKSKRAWIRCTKLKGGLTRILYTKLERGLAQIQYRELKGGLA